MIDRLAPYPEYRDSGLPWLGRYPQHWTLRRAKTLFHERVEKGYPQEPLLAATQTKGVIKKEDYETRTVTAQKDLHLLKLVKVGDYVISLRSFQGGIEIAHHRGIISPAYTVLRPREEAASGYYSHFFKSKQFIDSLSLFVTGIREGQNIDYGRLSRAEMPLPPPEEQAAIVRFLDHANGKIDRFIRAKRKLIALLNEQKQAIIHRAVTRGINPDAPLKPSGIPWLGDIPAHWNVRKVKTLVSTRGGMTPSKGNASFWGGDIPWVSPKDMKVPRIIDSKDHITANAVRQTGIPLIQPPAVLIVVRGMILARTFPTALTTVPVTVNQDMKALVPKPMLNPGYFVSLLTGIRRDLLLLVEIAGHGTCCLRTDSWENFALPVPPVIEQSSIEQYLGAQLAAQNSAIARTEREIALMQEYRTRLTADIVTGKLDVRHAAAQLPEAPADTEMVVAPESADETDILVDEETDAQ
jgi:type I restriction enzyme S subunit